MNALPYTTADAIRHADMLVCLHTAKKAALAGRSDEMCAAVNEFMALCAPDELRQFAGIIDAAVEREAAR